MPQQAQGYGMPAGDPMAQYNYLPQGAGTYPMPPQAPMPQRGHQ